MKTTVNYTQVGFTELNVCRVNQTGMSGNTGGDYEVVTNAILTEDGGYMLTEEGGYILQEEITRLRINKKKTYGRE